MKAKFVAVLAAPLFWAPTLVDAQAGDVGSETAPAAVAGVRADLCDIVVERGHMRIQVTGDRACSVRVVEPGSPEDGLTVLRPCHATLYGHRFAGCASIRTPRSQDLDDFGAMLLPTAGRAARFSKLEIAIHIAEPPGAPAEPTKPAWPGPKR